MNKFDLIIQETGIFAFDISVQIYIGYARSSSIGSLLNWHNRHSAPQKVTAYKCDYSSSYYKAFLPSYLNVIYNEIFLYTTFLQLIILSSLVHHMHNFNGPSRRKSIHTMNCTKLCFFRDYFPKDLDVHPQYFWRCMKNEMIHSQNFTEVTISE